MASLGRSIRQIDGLYAPISPDAYRIALRVGTKPYSYGITNDRTQGTVLCNQGDGSLIENCASAREGFGPPGDRNTWEQKQHREPSPVFNLCYSLAQRGGVFYKAAQRLSGADDPIKSSETVDLRPKNNMGRGARALYVAISKICHGTLKYFPAAHLNQDTFV